VPHFLSFFSAKIWARASDKGIFESRLQYDLDSIRGKIFDSLTNDPISFATITFNKVDSSIMTIVTNREGEFTIDVEQVRIKVQLSAIGYQERICYLTSNQSNLLRLAPANNLLPNVNVSSKYKRKPSANRIIKKVNQHIAQNYGDFSFDQKFIDHSITRNYDTTKSKMTELFTTHFNKGQKWMQEKKNLWILHIAMHFFLIS
jgi:hypothetical protein